MNKTIFIQQLKQLPRVGQGSDDVLKPKTDNQNTGGNVIDIGAITVANKFVSELNNNIAGLNTLLSATIKPIEDLNAKFGITSQLSQQIFNLNTNTYNNLLDQNIANSTILKQQEQLNSILPGQVYNLSRATGETQKLVTSQTQLVELGKVNEASAANFNRFVFASGQSTQEVNENLVRIARSTEIATGEVGVFRDMINAVGTLAAGTRSEFRGTAEELAQAALAATRVGTTLDDVRTSSKGYLNIEQSIQKELEAQLLTGKNLAKEMNQLRTASFTGDFDEVLRVQNKLIEENFEDIQKKGPPALNAFAESLNLTTDQVTTQFEMLTARNKVLADAPKLTLQDLQIQKDLSDTQKAALKTLEKQIKAKGELGENPLLTDILEDPNLKDAFNIIFPQDQIRDLRTTTEQVGQTLQSTQDAIAGTFSKDDFITLQTAITSAAKSISDAATKISTGDIKNIQDLFNAVTKAFTDDEFKQNLSKTINEAAYTGTTNGMTRAVSEKAPQLSEELSNRNVGKK